MRWTAGSGGPKYRLIGVCLEPGDELVEITCRYGLIHYEQHRCVSEQRDRLEIRDYIVLERIDLWQGLVVRTRVSLSMLVSFLLRLVRYQQKYQQIVRIPTNDRG